MTEFDVSGWPSAPSITARSPLPLAVRGRQWAMTALAIIAVMALCFLSHGLVFGTLASYERLTGQYRVEQFSWLSPNATLKLPDIAPAASLTIVGRAPHDQHWTLECAGTRLMTVDLRAGFFRQSLPFSALCAAQGLTIQSDWSVVPAAGGGSRDPRSLSYQLFALQSGADAIPLTAVLAHSAGVYTAESEDIRSDPIGVLTGRWDATWYRGIAEHGYRYDGNGRVQQNVAWPFLFPMLVKGVAAASGLSIASAMIWLNAGLVFTALLVLFFIGRVSGLTRSLALVAPVWLSFNAFGFFLVGGFSEPLFLTLEFLLVLLLLRRHYGAALVTLALLSATRFIGVIGVAWFALTIWRDASLSRLGRLVRIAVAGIMGVLGIVADSLIKGLQTGHPLAAFTVRKSWSTTPFSVLGGIFDLSALFSGDYLLTLVLAALLAGYALYIGLRTLGPTGSAAGRLLLGAGVSLVAATLILNPELHSAGRYFLPFAPAIVGMLCYTPLRTRSLALILIATAAGAAFMPLIVIRIAMAQAPF